MPGCSAVYKLPPLVAVYNILCNIVLHINALMPPGACAAPVITCLLMAACPAVMQQHHVAGCHNALLPPGLFPCENNLHPPFSGVGVVECFTQHHCTCTNHHPSKPQELSTSRCLTAPVSNDNRLPPWSQSLKTSASKPSATQAVHCAVLPACSRASAAQSPFQCLRTATPHCRFRLQQSNEAACSPT